MAKLLDRLLLFLYSLSIAILAVLAILQLSGVVPFNEIDYDNDTIFVTSIIVLVVLFLLSIRFFYISIRRDRNSIPSIDQRTEYGEIQISVETIENLCLKAASKVRGVRDLKARIRVTQAGIDITIRAVVEGDLSIPVMTSDIQKQVHDYLQETTGIPVANVTVYIANVAQSPSFKSRVE
ncbi:putative alkaline shock family protein YloU [Paenibacillus sp. DS2015]|uniref:alkaline shock response membrane anchor protein AmaP n=1 Tax=Paenibacillus sp. DS2015 TaxID=3373917 RepID=UPI003D20EE77